MAVRTTPARVNIRPVELVRRRSKNGGREATVHLKEECKTQVQTTNLGNTSRFFSCGKGCEESRDRVGHVLMFRPCNIGQTGLIRLWQC